MEAVRCVAIAKIGLVKINMIDIYTFAQYGTLLSSVWLLIDVFNFC